jgi:hypothetical protein
MLRPYVTRDHDNAMYVIGHNDKCIRFGVREMVRNCEPTFLHNAPQGVQLHLALNHIPKETQAVMNANRHEIRAMLRVIVPLQPNGAAVVGIWVEGHHEPP